MNCLLILKFLCLLYIKTLVFTSVFIYNLYCKIKKKGGHSLLEKNILYATQIQYLKNLTIDEYEILKLLSKASNSLYNVALYNVRQYFFQTKKIFKL